MEPMQSLVHTSLPTHSRPPGSFHQEISWVFLRCIPGAMIQRPPNALSGTMATIVSASWWLTEIQANAIMCQWDPRDLGYRCHRRSDLEKRNPIEWRHGVRGGVFLHAASPESS